MSLVPDSKSEKILFFKVRLASWAERAAEIGTTPEAVEDLIAKTNNAAAALASQGSAQAAAQSATTWLHEALEAMAIAGASIIAQIRARANMNGDGVYSLALIPPPADPSPIGAPGKPDKFSFTVDDLGAVHLKWKCANPAGSVGTMYQVRRRIAGESEFKYIGGSGAKSFVDDTLPPGTASVIYQVQAIRSTKVGAEASFNVCFGVSANIPKAMLNTSVRGRARLAA